MKKFLPIAGVLLVFAISAFALVKIYDKGKDRKPLRYADVPQETIDWINSIGDGINDIISSFNPNPIPTPWGNGGDVGKDPESGLLTLEDEYFIVYYPQSLARQSASILSMAHKAIPRMEDIIGKYYYPDDMNGRKVPIYLAKDQSEFNRLMALFNCRGTFDSVSGITIYTVSPSGVFLHAIALNGRHCFQDEQDTREVLWHEMTHYCFAAAVDYCRPISLPKWCTEGIAEYTGRVGCRPSFTESEIEMLRRDCHLMSKTFEYVFEVYSGGHSVFCHMEDRYRVAGVKAFLGTLYTDDIPTSLSFNFSTTLSAFEADWKENLDKFKRK